MIEMRAKMLNGVQSGWDEAEKNVEMHWSRFYEARVVWRGKKVLCRSCWITAQLGFNFYLKVNAS